MPEDSDELRDVHNLPPLGAGKDGEVYQTRRRSAIKKLSSIDNYRRELRAYQILAELEVSQILDHEVPRLVAFNDTDLTIEMTIVRPPFLLDFVASYTDEEIEWLGFTDEVMAEREGTWSEQFGERWVVVQSLVGEFHRLTGLMLLDLSPNNIRFE